jgi:hypothetical protein
VIEHLSENIACAIAIPGAAPKILVALNSYNLCVIGDKKVTFKTEQAMSSEAIIIKHIKDNLCLMRDKSFIYVVDVERAKAFRLFESPYFGGSGRHIMDVMTFDDRVEVHSLEIDPKTRFSQIKRIEFSFSALKKLTNKV